MPEYKILNSKEIKETMRLVKEQWGADLKLDFGFLQNTKNRIFIINREISGIDLSKLRVNSVGMYFCEVDSKGIRLSIEGSQLIGLYATKNVVELNKEETMQWLKGEELQKECEGCSGFVIIRHGKDCIGTGKYSKGRILNYVGKTRRISASV